MNNEKLEQAAQRYADLVRQIKEAERNASKAQSDLTSLKTQRSDAASALREFVGANIRRKAATLSNGIVVTIEHMNDAAPLINVYENGEEIA